MQGGACLATRANAHRAGDAATGYARPAARIVSPRARYPSVSHSALGLSQQDSRHGGDERPSGQGAEGHQWTNRRANSNGMNRKAVAAQPGIPGLRPCCCAIASVPLLPCHCRAQQPIGLRPPRAAGTGRSSTSSKGSLALPWGAWPCPRSTPCARRSTQKSARPEGNACPIHPAAAAPAATGQPHQACRARAGASGTWTNCCMRLSSCCHSASTSGQSLATSMAAWRNAAWCTSNCSAVNR